MTEFRVGDVVRLKSGGERMTVEGGEVTVRCVFFRRHGDDWSGPVRESFAASALVLAEPPKEAT